MDKKNISHAFSTFIEEAPGHSQAWLGAVRQLDAAGALEQKTAELAYLAVLAAMRLEGGISFHVKEAKALGASREEIISAILVGLPAAGNTVIQSLPIALAAFDD